MYHYVEDKAFLSRMRRVCGDIMQDLCHILKEEYDIGATFFLVGSGKRKLIMQNAKHPVDLDYNLEIIRCGDFEDCCYIKEAVRKAFNKALALHEWGDCQDSKSALTTERRHFLKGNPTEFSIDVCIVVRDEDDNYYRLIHEKTGYRAYDRYFWNEAPHSCDVFDKAVYIKDCGEWQALKEEYKRIKNLYLQHNDNNHPSFVCYVEAVNNVYNSLQ